MKRTLLIFITAIATLTACTDEMPATMNETDTFSRQLIGQWEIESVDITPVSTNKSVGISVSKENACSQVAKAFEAKDVVSKFCIQFNNDQVRVSKYYTCSLAPEQLTWQLALNQSGAKNINWVSGNTFTINEVNEGHTQATYQLAFFNLNNNSPEGVAATPETANTMILDVKYDSKESSQSFKMTLKKTL